MIKKLDEAIKHLVLTEIARTPEYEGDDEEESSPKPEGRILSTDTEGKEVTTDDEDDPFAGVSYDEKGEDSSLFTSDEKETKDPEAPHPDLALDNFAHSVDHSLSPEEEQREQSIKTVPSGSSSKDVKDMLKRYDVPDAKSLYKYPCNYRSRQFLNERIYQWEYFLPWRYCSNYLPYSYTRPRYWYWLAQRHQEPLRGK